MSLNKSIKYLEDLKKNKNIDIDVIKKMQDKIKSLDEALLLDIQKLVEEKLKPIRKVWYLAIKAKEKDVKEYEELQNRWVEKMGTIFPEAKITISLCKDKIIRNSLGRIEVIKDEKE